MYYNKIAPLLRNYDFSTKVYLFVSRICFVIRECYFFQSELIICFGKVCFARKYDSPKKAICLHDAR